ncbi:MAG: 50S ribosomal protein L29 [Candidatus Saccharibacteria bacterium]
MAKIIKKSAKTTKNAIEVKTIDQLKLDLVSKQKDLNESKRGHKLGELTNPRVITITRKEIARLHTAIRAAEIAQIKENK